MLWHPLWGNVITRDQIRVLEDCTWIAVGWRRKTSLLRCCATTPALPCAEEEEHAHEAHHRGRKEDGHELCVGQQVEADQRDVGDEDEAGEVEYGDQGGEPEGRNAWIESNGEWRFSVRSAKMMQCLGATGSSMDGDRGRCESTQMCCKEDLVVFHSPTVCLYCMCCIVTLYYSPTDASTACVAKKVPLLFITHPRSASTAPTS